MRLRLQKSYKIWSNPGGAIGQSHWGRLIIIKEHHRFNDKINFEKIGNNLEMNKIKTEWDASWKQIDPTKKQNYEIEVTPNCPRAELNKGSEGLAQ